MTERARRRSDPASDTRRRLIAGALAAINQHGIAGVSARTIAAAAGGVNQALVFYHFGGVDELLAAACLASTRERVARWSVEMAEVGSLRELLAVGQRMHEEERAAGNVAVLAQLLAGAQTDPKLAEATGAALALWVAEIELVLRRTLAGQPFSEVLDVPGLARAVSAAFVGLELYEGVDADGAAQAIAALDQLAVLFDVVEAMGPIARKAVRSRVARAARARPGRQPGVAGEPGSSGRPRPS
ncbi:TetR/AcrR family transcriptional regulator [Pilimelia columellifera]|uniref:TetR family transcriptional regulator n=1 Tax=Pilimelia columellifera subsp. columellifera TaxID=706583 RepID=A0ABN3NRI7_9ACTN